jgi:PAS domain S-box-containing protein
MRRPSSDDRKKTKAQLLEELEEARVTIATLKAGPSSSAVSTFTETVANLLPGTVYVFNHEGRLLWWNGNVERITGYTAEELTGAPLSRFLAQGDLPRMAQRFQDVLTTGAAAAEASLVLKNGATLPYHFTGRRVELDGLPCVVGIGIDISERDRADRRRGVRLAVTQLLAQATSLPAVAPRLVQALCEGLDWDLGAVWLVDREAQVLRCLDLWHVPAVSAIEFAQTSRQLLLAAGVGLPGRVWNAGKPLWVTDVVHDANFPRAQLALAEGLHGAFAFPILAGAELLGVVEFFSHEVREPDADLLETMATVGAQVGQFIQRTAAEEALRRSEARKGAMLEASLDCVISIDHEEHILEFNQAAEQTFGHARTAVLGRKIADVMIPLRLREAHRLGMAKYLATGEGPVLGSRIELPALRADGTEFPAEISIVARELAGRPVFTAYLRDITERKRADQALRESEGRFRAIFEQSPQSMQLLTPDGYLLQANRAFEALFGVKAEELRKVNYCLLHDPQSEAVGAMPYLRRGFGGEPTWLPPAYYSAEKTQAGAHQGGVWIGALIYPIKDEASVIREVIVMHLDHTETKRAEREIRQLNADLERRVAERTAELSAANAHLSAEIVERAKVAEELRRARDAAEVSARAKDQFLATVSHELRTPLNGVIGMVDLLGDSPLDSRQRRYVQVARTSADLLLSVINDILDFSKLEAGKLDLDRSDFNPAEVVEEVVAMLAVHAEDKNLELACQVDPNADTWVSGDRTRLRQVLTNLVANAIKFTERGDVVVRVAADPGAVSLSFEVNDTGIGIPADQLDRLFQPFSQVDASRTRRFGGTGLGLAISRQLVQIMGGEIGVKSEPGCGSTFWFTVHLASPEQSHPEARLDTTSLRGTHMLIVDDNATNRNILQAQLASCGIETAVASGGSQALELLRRAAQAGRPFTLAILDMHMSGMDGLQLAAAIKAEPSIAATILVLLSSISHQTTTAELATRGVAGFATKPVGRGQLFAVLASALTGKRSSAEFCLPATASLSAPEHRPLHVLVAEDTKANQLVAVGLLEKLGHRVRLADNGNLALRAWEEEAFDLILMDLQMPELDGLQATARIREREQARGTRTPIVALTAYATRADRDRCLAAGMDAYIAKPIRRQDLARVIDELVPASQEAPEKVFDPDTTLARLEGDVSLLAALIDVFLKEAPGQLAALQSAVGGDDAPKTAQAAHRLNGLARQFDAFACVEAALKLEKVALAGNLSNAGAEYTEVERQLDRLRSALLNHRAKLGDSDLHS